MLITTLILIYLDLSEPYILFGWEEKNRGKQAFSTVEMLRHKYQSWIKLSAFFFSRFLFLNNSSVHIKF